MYKDKNKQTETLNKEKTKVVNNEAPKLSYILQYTPLLLSQVSSHLCQSSRNSLFFVLFLSVNAVQSLIAYPVNSTCVILTWTLSPHTYVITSFVIEWKNLNKEEEMKWVRVPPNTSKYYIYGECVLENVMCYVVIE